MPVQTLAGGFGKLIDGGLEIEVVLLHEYRGKVLVVALRLLFLLFLRGEAQEGIGRALERY